MPDTTAPRGAFMPTPVFAAPQLNPFGLIPITNPASPGSVYANPTFADIDADGDLDAFIGRQFQDTLVFLNTGSATAPAFAAPLVSPWGLFSSNTQYVSPALADINGDGTLDFFSGNIDGETLVFLNTGTPTAPAFAPSTVNPYGLATVPFTNLLANPTLADIDNDGDLDVFVGEFNGCTLVYMNTGSATAPAFGAATTNPFGLVDMGTFANPDFADIDGDGDLDAIISNELGNIRVQLNTGSLTAPAFAARVTNPYGFVISPSFAAISLVDIDRDGDLDAFIGNSAGNTNFFLNTGNPVAPVTSVVANGTYGVGSVITLTVAFNEVVLVTGTPTLRLETGTIDRNATYVSGSGTNTLTFAYTVQAGDASADLDFEASNALALNGGSIADAAGNQAILTLAAPGAAASLAANKALVIETTPPVLASAVVDGSQLVLTYTDANDLNATQVAATSAFAVVSGGSANAVTGVVVNATAKTVTLTLASAVTTGQAVTVAYTDPTVGNDANATQDVAGNDAASFAATAVTNNTPLPPPANTPASSLTVIVPTNGLNNAPQQGDTLSLNTQTLTDPDGLGVLGYEWLRDGTLIPNATGPTLLLLAQDVNTRITVVIRYTDGQGNAEQISSGATPLITDNDGVPNALEALAPAPLQSGVAGLVGDGNGDGLVDTLQVNVTSAPLPATSGFITVVADSNKGLIDTTDANQAVISQFKAEAPPPTVPTTLKLNAVIRLNAAIGNAGQTETFSIFVDATTQANGFWVRDKNGTWNNIATGIELVGDKTRIDFAITDGGLFDADGTANGVIQVAGGAGYMPLSLVGQPADVLPGTGFWF